MTIVISGKTVDQATLVVDGIDMADWPKLCDAYFESGSYTDGTAISDEDLEFLTNQEYELLVERITDQIY